MLRIDSLDAHYGLFQALFGVSLHVAPGETLALIGSNGDANTHCSPRGAGALTVGHAPSLLHGDCAGGKP
jgi:branched-chain amino acid transport system ATP-binding protein